LTLIPRPRFALDVPHAIVAFHTAKVAVACRIVLPRAVAGFLIG
jgi:hypothetical protein